MSTDRDRRGSGIPARGIVRERLHGQIGDQRLCGKVEFNDRDESVLSAHFGLVVEVLQAQRWSCSWWSSSRYSLWGIFGAVYSMDIMYLCN